MANQNFRVKAGLEVGTGVTISAGIITATSFVGNLTGNNLTGNLNSTGVSTFTNGPVFIGAATSTGTASQRLQVTGNAYVSGNLGIGVTNPAAKLVVGGDVRLAGTDAEIEFNTGGARLKGRTNSLSIHTGGGLDTETGEVVRINTSGVGIGTTNPVGQLQVSSGPVIIGAATSTGTASQPLQVTGGGYFSSSVGIGTTNPQASLHVVGSGTTTLLVEGNARITGILTVGTSSVTFDGTNNTVTVGTGVTIFGNTGIISATEFRGNGANLTGVQPFPSGTLMLFQQTAAPTGWTKQTTHNNKTLRVVSGSASSGGTTAFTSVFASRTPSGSVTMSNAAVTLSESQIPSHTHTFTVTEADDNNHSGNGNNSAANADAGINGTVTTAATGGSTSHTHNNTASFTGTAMDFDIQYVDLIIASRD